MSLGRERFWKKRRQRVLYWMLVIGGLAGLILGYTLRNPIEPEIARQLFSMIVTIDSVMVGFATLTITLARGQARYFMGVYAILFMVSFWFLSIFLALLGISYAGSGIAQGSVGFNFLLGSLIGVFTGIMGFIFLLLDVLGHFEREATQKMDELMKRGK